MGDLRSFVIPVVFSMSETSEIVSLKKMDTLSCHMTGRQKGQFNSWGTAAASRR